MKTLVALTLALTASFASAKDANDPFAACHQDMRRLCGDVKPGEGRIVKCMMDNQAKASPACAQLLERKKQAQNKPK